MGRADYFRDGDFNRICDQCGRKFKASDTAMQWDGVIACSDCLDPRHPQDFVRGKRDRQRVPWSSPMPTPILLSDVYVDENNIEYADENGILYRDS
jgi:hypothetical protein